ncbi:indole-3-glycerol phosphate synthase TrpC [Robiginitalea sp. M366]|uniref:indole-3-glycerol phosphate synthase TrpC n=1 Tax=Robiginitalea aestuariiviva TaxID=3036903 RepID=UPI00240D6157|nr:indole-3-glycerol phosphate synthase TrpC [Robiginitalea aestuariiviva]MDG1570722.1 indole-3-glycerol phosphate synthase TrpC [Robiginitalea aestuariiviva]
MNILQQIAADKRREITLKKTCVPEAQLRGSALFSMPTRSLKASLEARPFGIIAEHKRRSPSREVINQSVPLPAVVGGYDAAGAGGVSVLTDGTYFGGSLEDLLLARATTDLPLLRKEFILDPYQLLEARAYGADAILLIAALLPAERVTALTHEAHELGLEVLLEVHDQEELDDNLECGADLFGVNNRNLKTFEVSLKTSRQLAPHIPEGALKVSESGLDRPEELRELHALGYRGFLMGERFMKHEDPGRALELFLQTLTP